MKHTAQQMAANFGHTNIDSSATLRSIVNPDAHPLDMYDGLMHLCICGTGTDAFFQWVAYDDQIGDRFYEIDGRELWEPVVYTASGLDRDNPHIQWLKEMK